MQLPMSQYWAHRLLYCLQTLRQVLRQTLRLQKHPGRPLNLGRLYRLANLRGP